MGAKSKGLGGAKQNAKGPEIELAPHENPLVRNETLRQMYRKMVEARLLEEHLLRIQRKTKAKWRLESSRGQEACRVGLTQGLMAGDIVMDSRAGGLTGHLLGVKLPFVVRALGALSTGKAAATGSTEGLFPFIDGAEARLFAATGAGVLLKTLQKRNVVVVYVSAREAGKRVWRQVLKFAVELDLPIIFVVLPRVAKIGSRGNSSRVREWAKESGVPGIPVDTSDAVALYRVAQESMGRIRGDGGPVLIECVTSKLESPRQSPKNDPIPQLKDFLLGRRVCTVAWMDGVEKRFRERLSPVRS